MAKVGDEVFDSQLFTENVSFLNNCFDNSFSIQSTLVAVKEYVRDTEIIATNANVPSSQSNRKTNTTVLNTTNALYSSACNNTNITLYCSENKVVYHRNLKAWGLPQEIAKKYEERGIKEMFDWQVTCLANSKVLMDCCNLVYSAPTSAGKTLVAEILTIKTLLERQKKVIIILPFVSIVREKMFYLQDILSSSGIRVEGFMGSQSPPGGLQSVHVAICTIEKANSLVNRLLDEGNMSELGAVIVDELHLLGDPHRGYILELLLTKIMYVSSVLDNVQIQIVGMSATLPNLEVLADWLSAELFITQFRPIPLDEYCLVGKRLYDKNGSCVNIINNVQTVVDDSESVLHICLNTIKENCSILIFCMTKNRCENLAQSLASSFFKLGSKGEEMGVVLRQQLNTESISEVLEQLKNCPIGLDQVLKNTISFGVAYHHAGLTFDERDIIEGAFKSGAIRVLVATSTLSSGVNLPARKVIVRSPVFQRQPINILTYKQMIGRAGRMGKDTKGESILICTESEKKIGFDLMMGALDPVKSCIESEDKFMRAVLEMIASRVACTKDDLIIYSKCTLLFNQPDVTLSQSHLLDNTLDQLINYELIRIQADVEKKYVATPLGRACLSSSMAPNDGLSLFCELQKARQCLVLETDLHLIYLVTPYSVSSQWGEIDWLHLLSLWESLTKAMKRVGELVGVQESFIIRCLRGTTKIKDTQNKLNIHKRFYTALALQDLVNEVPLSEVAAKFQCARGFLQSLQQAAATFAGMVTAFCHQLGWKNMEMLISQFQDRLHFGIHSELLELMKLQSLNGKRARTLFDAGYETISSIASADASAIENVLHKAVPFQSEKERDDDDSDDLKKRNKIKSIWITGCCGLTTKEAAEKLIIEARKYLELEIGVAEIKWNIDISNKTTSGTECKSGNMNVENYSVDPLKAVEVKNESDNIKDTDKRDIDIKLSQALVEVKSESDSNDEPNDCIQDILTINDQKIENQSSCYIKSNISKPSQKIVLSATSSPSILKDEAWDSLNLNESVFGNDSDNDAVSNMFSPNASGRKVIDKLATHKSTDNYSVSTKTATPKDISLFSSEGDTSSLFEESLPLDLIPSKLLDDLISNNTNNQTITSRKQEVTTDFISINSNSILNAFKTTIVEIEDHEDNMKLVYDDKLSENELECNLNLSQDIEVIETQDYTDTFKSPFKRHGDSSFCDSTPLAKKIRTLHSSSTTRVFVNSSMKLLEAESKRFILQISYYKMNCFVLRGRDVLDNFALIESVQDAAVYLDTKSIIKAVNNEVIGMKIINQKKPEMKKTVAPPLIRAIAVYINQETIIYFDLCSLKDNFSTMKSKLADWFIKKAGKLKMMSLKYNYLKVKKCFGISLPTCRKDVSLIEWLIDSDEKIPDVTYLVKKYCSIDLSSISIKIDNREKRLKTLDEVEILCVKSWGVGMVADSQSNSGQACRNMPAIFDIELKVSKILADCEFYGVTVDKTLASQLLIDVKNSQEILQKKAYKLCGYYFNFNSSKDVAKLLGIYKGRKVSTKKSVLTSHNSPMASIVIFWRKLNSILTKTLYPLTEKACIYSDGNRITPSYTMYTCTGRISMHEPNLQNVPRTFSVPAHYLTASETCEDLIEFNCRNIFKAAKGCCLVSADYCQLEMRILTHYSGDETLTRIMRSDVDVFKAIAASWGNVPEEEVDDDLRQKAKQLCYGILYGMGNKTLSQNLDVSEQEAALFMDAFYKTYPGIQMFTRKVIEDCRQKGYVETLMKRRRYLPDIKSVMSSKKCTAERQAVNTTIQGSAADIAKAAMVTIDTKTRQTNTQDQPHLILQMHDELIYEVPENFKSKFITILKEAMEGTVRLKVPLPVKVRSGFTWGTLEEIKS